MRQAPTTLEESSEKETVFDRLLLFLRFLRDLATHRGMVDLLKSGAIRLVAVVKWLQEEKSMIDMGKTRDGKQLWYTGGRSIAELMRDGEIVALPDTEEGIAYKRPERCTPLELAAQYTVEEARRVIERWNAELDR